MSVPPAPELKNVNGTAVSTVNAATERSPKMLMFVPDENPEPNVTSTPSGGGVPVLQFAGAVQSVLG